jgi:hypothetical protein
MKTPCPACEGLGHLIGRDGELAQATVCACQEACATCRGTRFRIVRDGPWDVAVPCDCARGFERVRAFNAAGIPAAYAQKTLSLRGPDDPAGFRDRKLESLVRAKLLVTRYQQLAFGGPAAKPAPARPRPPSELTRGTPQLPARAEPTPAPRAESPRGLVLVGAPGLGKTHLACALLTHLTLERGIGCRFVDYYQLLARIRSTFDGRGGAESEASILAPLVETPVLVLDDLGKGQATPWEWTIVDQLITRRYNAGRVVIATTNFLLADDLDRRAQQPQGGRRRADESLEDRIGDRLVSRLRETCEFCLLEGSDYRPLIGARRT